MDGADADDRPGHEDIPDGAVSDREEDGIVAAGRRLHRPGRVDGVLYVRRLHDFAPVVDACNVERDRAALTLVLAFKSRLLRNWSIAGK
jgi:hypothetical protein